MHATDPPPPKPSRYRTIRGKNVPESRRPVEQPLQPAEPPPPSTQTPLATSDSNSSNDASTLFKRFPSRYVSRRSMRCPGLPTATAATPPMPSESASLSPQASPPSSHMRHADAAAPPASTGAQHATAPAPAPPASASPFPFQPLAIQTQSLPQPLPTQTLQSPLHLVPLPRRDIFDDETDEASDYHHLLLEEQKRKDLERLQKELAAASLLPPVDPKRQSKSPSRERFHIFHRRKTDKTERESKTLHKQPPTRTSTPRAKTPPPPMPSTTSANASPIGEPGCRYVVVRRQQFSATISVLPETTVADALEAAAPLLPAGLVDLSASILVESYQRLGLERRLRRYERVRDIMNTWDTDADNTFVIMRSGAVDARGAAAHPPSAAAASSTRFGHPSDLDLQNVPRGRAPPPGAGFLSVQMHHSQKPGRWNKRYISLLEDSGQLVLSKKEDPDSHDLTGLCHLSDYDIYLPTDAQMKMLRPPKTYCFAVKSQQRTTVFVNPESYVHFFSTDDAAVARLFYDRVFAWRSWYLAKRLPSEPRDTRERRPSTAKQSAEEREPVDRERCEKEKSRPPVSMALLKNGLQRSLSRRSTGGSGVRGGSAPPASTTHEHARRPTDESLHGGIGDLDAILDQSRERQPHMQRERGRSQRSDRSNPDAVDVGGGLQSAPIAPSSWFPSASEHSAQQTHHIHAQNHTHRSRSIARDAQDSSRSASRRASQTRPESQEDIPLGLQYPQLVQQQMQSATGLGRSRSTRSTRRAPLPDTQAPPVPAAPALPQPLIDLTPKFQEAPQWSKEGKGHGVRAPKGAHLVDLATDRNPRQPTDFAGLAALRRDANAINGGSNNNYPPPTRAGRSLTMTSASEEAAKAAAVSRSRSVAHRGRAQAPSVPVPVPLLARIPSNNAGMVGEARERH